MAHSKGRGSPSPSRGEERQQPTHSLFISRKSLYRSSPRRPARLSAAGFCLLPGCTKCAFTMFLLSKNIREGVLHPRLSFPSDQSVPIKEESNLFTFKTGRTSDSFFKGCLIEFLGNSFFRTLAQKLPAHREWRWSVVEGSGNPTSLGTSGRNKLLGFGVLFFRMTYW